MSINNVNSRAANLDRPSFKSGHIAWLMTGIAILIGILFSINALTQSEATSAIEESGLQNVTYSNALALFYAEPWLNSEQDIAAYNEALSMQYAQPWVDQVKSTKLTFITQGNGLVMQYAGPWINAANEDSCLGRLDMRYACENGYQP